jgi:protein TonB
LDPVALGRGWALLASAAIHAGLLVAAGFALGPSRSAGPGAERSSAPVLVHLPARPVTQARAESMPVVPATVPRIVAAVDDDWRTAPIAARDVPAEAVRPVAAVAGPIRDAVPRSTTVAVANDAPREGRERHREASDAGPVTVATVAAAYLRAPEPEYPPRARDEGLEGLVVLRVRVSRAGEPAEIRVAASSGHRLLDRAAEAAVARWQFQPARRGDEAIEAWMEVPIRFRLQQG